MERRIDGGPGREDPVRTAAPTTEASEEPEAQLPAGEPEAPVGPTVRAPESAAEEPPAEPVPTLGDDLDKLAAKAQKADEYLELAQRTKADFENYRKRAAREAAAAQDRGVAKLAKELLPAVDNLDRALAAAQQHSNGDDLVSGIKLVHADVIAALARVGIEPFSPEGERFDPTHHEAIAQQPVEGAEPGTVVEVYQRGYRLGENVLRPARVVVAG
jgi:molecular chaperone GrpE